MIKVDKNIPMPADPRGRSQKYPWAEMKVGDSFFVEGATIAHMSGCASWRRKRHHEKYTCRTCEGGVRVWRIK